MTKIEVHYIKEKIIKMRWPGVFRVEEKIAVILLSINEMFLDFYDLI